MGCFGFRGLGIWGLRGFWRVWVIVRCLRFEGLGVRVGGLGFRIFGCRFRAFGASSNSNSKSASQ